MLCYHSSSVVVYRVFQDVYHQLQYVVLRHSAPNLGVRTLSLEPLLKHTYLDARDVLCEPIVGGRAMGLCIWALLRS